MNVRATLVLLLGLAPGFAPAQLPAPTPFPAQLPVPQPSPVAPSPPLPVPTPFPNPAESIPVPGAIAGPSPGPAGEPAPTWVFAAEWLHWWGKLVPTPPLLTSSLNPDDNGILGRSSTYVLAGGGEVRFKGLEGFRLQARACVGEPYGADLTGFHVTNGGRYQNVLAGILAVPYTDPATGQNASLVLASPLPNGPTGYAAVEDYIQLYGFEAQAVMRYGADFDPPIELLGGVRYLQLSEELALRTFTKTNATATFLGQMTPSGTTFVGQDTFGTRNHFLGVQGGVRGRWLSQRCTVEGAFTVAVGTTHQELTVYGDTSLNVPAQQGALGYVFTQKTNIGRFTREAFTLVPQGRVTVAYNVFDLVRIFVGFDCLYWSDVARPPSQLSPLVSPSLIPLVTTGPQVGASPPPRFVGTDYWAMGISIGIDLSF